MNHRDTGRDNQISRRQSLSSQPLRPRQYGRVGYAEIQEFSCGG